MIATRLGCLLAAVLLAGCSVQSVPMPATLATTAATPSGPTGTVTVVFKLDGETKSIEVADVAQERPSKQ